MRVALRLPQAREAAVTLLVVLALVALSVFTVLDAFMNPPTRRLPEPPAEVEYWPSFLHELEI